jgi:hypothetical protein
VRPFRDAQGRLLFAVLLGALFAAGLAFRLAHLGDPLRYDEAFTYIRYVDQPLRATLTDYHALNNHFLNSLLARLASGLLGDRPPLWRLPNFAAGAGTLLLVGFIARRWFGNAAAAVALAAAAVNPVMAHFSALARGYGLSLFFGLAALYAVDRRHGGGRGIAASIGACVCSALAAYAVPTALLFVAAVFAYDVYMVRRRRRAAAALAALWGPTALLIALLYAGPLVSSTPGAIVAGFGDAGGSNAAPFSSAGVRPYGEALLEARTWGPGGGRLWLPLAALGLAAASVRRPAYGILAAAALLAGAALLATGYRPPARVFIYFLPLVALGVGAAAQTAWERLRLTAAARTAAGAALVVAVAAAVVIAEKGRYLDDASRAGAAPAARPIVEYLAAPGRAGVRVVATSPLNYPLMYYASRVSGGAVEVLTGRSPRAYTYDAFVAVPAGTPLREVVREGTGGRGVVLRAARVTSISDVGLWRALIVCPSPPSD